ncbi:hypothetical protein D7C54_19815 [Salmonella enterica]|uniref:Uncharacterized protein n=1 Tax=Salmonella muenchen TaxID=596 RepID=A0A5U9NYJ1_SALMU|nr:hypothetical protein [Salmonella enterica subsp. enterica serovar Tennessee]EAO0543504.1 hypothetical protein [Salmonella enterica]EBQ5984375.1 hypothetical protein [Salmonella enterica subsp. houtenae serovar Houten]EBR0042527.1 hypothetical protein [Salmonella enterica subsp. enterica serovar Oranienburg]EBR0419317.1 hypothetical protein [Salmonella enterica subsp. enterica serovar Weltevreden]EBS3167686.1 hypothetical protein [Salmonella enterica subsp. enterica serovar Muenchen]EBS3902
MLDEQKKVCQTTASMIACHRAHTAAKCWKRRGAIWWHGFRYPISNFFIAFEKGPELRKRHPVMGGGGVYLKGAKPLLLSHAL